MDHHAAAWYFFAGVVLFFMGLSLGLDADAHARAAADWPGGGPGGSPPGLAARLARACRLGGGVLSLAGAYILALLRWSPQSFERFRPAALSPAGRLAGGAALVLAGLAMATLRLVELAAPRRGYSFLEEEAPASARLSPARRVAFWSGWIVIFTLIAFGASLLSRRTPAENGGIPHESRP